MPGSASDRLAGSGAAIDSEQADVDRAGATPCSAKDWIAIELVDEDGAAVADQDVLVILPDGSERRARTGPDGVVRFNGFAAGGAAGCTVSFPGLDDALWRSK